MTNQSIERFDPPIERRLDELTEISEIFGDFMQVERATHRDQRPETDAEHTLHVMFLAMAYTAKYHPEFNPMEVASLLMVHDLDEVYVGDVNSLLADEAVMAEKEVSEAKSRQFLRYKFADQPFMMELLERYWRQDEPITRFARSFEKIDPSFAHLRDQGRAIRAMEGVDGPEELRAMNARALSRMVDYAPPDVIAMRQVMGERVVDRAFTVY